jgi:hypothetical protein
MLTRTTQQTITFENAFSLSGIEQMQPPGSYVVEIEEELIAELSFPAYRRTATVIYLCSSRSGCAGGYEAAIIDPLDLDAAIQRDAVLGSNLSIQPTREVQTSSTEASRTAPQSSGTLFFGIPERFKRAAARLRSRDDWNS